MAKLRRHGRAGGSGLARSLWPVVAFLVAALLLGGAGIGYPLTAMVIEIGAVALIVRIAIAPRSAPLGWGFWSILAVFGGWVVLGLAQIVPLPPAFWHGLPGRATAVSIYAVLNWGSAWHALSLTPSRTVGDLLAVLPALAGFLVVATLPAHGRAIVLRTIVGVAVAATFLGAIQVAAGAGGALMPFQTMHRGHGVGLFVNRNHQAAFLLVAMLLAAVPGVIPMGGGKDRGERATPRGVIFAIIGFLALGVLATTSRTGLTLLPFVMMVAIAIALDRRMGNAAADGAQRIRLLGAIALFTVVAIALYPTILVQRTLARFASAGEDLRYQYWENTRFAIGEAMPWGTGFGSFASIYRTVEPLSEVAPPWINHAHNEYLELVLEGGAAAAVLMIVGLGVALTVFSHRWWRSRGRTETMSVVAGASGCVIILLCSIVDFPLRMAALVTVFGVLLGFAVAPPRSSAGDVKDVTPRQSRRIGRIVSIVMGLVVGGLSLSNGLAIQFATNGLPAAAVAVAPWVADGWAELANQEQIAGNLAESGAAGEQALRIAPLDPEALRAVASASLARRNDSKAQARGEALMQAGAALGWRDTVTQLWLARRALELGVISVASERIDGLLRRGVQPETMLRQLRAMLPYPGGREAIVARLAQRPPWEQGFLNAIADDAAGDPAIILDLLRRLARAGVPITTRTTALIRWRLADAGDYAAVRAVWRLSGGQGLIGDGDFTASSGVVPTAAAPFAWQVPAQSGVHLTIAEPDAAASLAQRSVMVAADGFATGPVLAQMIVLAPGRYRLGMGIRALAGPPGLRSNWTLTCHQAGVAGAPVAIGGGQAVSLQSRRYVTDEFTVPGDCPGQRLALTIAGAGQSYTLQIDNVRLEPAVVDSP